MGSSSTRVHSKAPVQEQCRQQSLPGFCCPLSAAVEILAKNGGIEARGAIFTRREVVEFLLDLTGYTSDRKLHSLRLLEPSFGRGDFLLPAIERLLESWRSFGQGDPVEALSGSVRAVELHRETFEKSRSLVIELLAGNDVTRDQATRLADVWLVNDDFLLADIRGKFNIVVGNPPYVRQELIPDVLVAEYRNRYLTVFDRADLYIPFIERSLTALAEGGVLGFICADRWMKNRYGGPLRKLIFERFHLKIYVDMVNTPAFHSEVIAYPAITVIAREQGKTTRMTHQPPIEAGPLRALARAFVSINEPPKETGIQSIDGVASGAEPWILDSSDQLSIIRRLEAAFPLLEEAGCKVGIGVATGADKDFIGPFNELDVEDDRKIPLVMTKDIEDGTVRWRGLGVINPFADNGGLVDLTDYPRLRRYLDARKNRIAGRHCAQKAPANWYRTIDRITPVIANIPKLLIPDIKGQEHIVYEDGQFYPHHNLYYVISDIWDLRALQAVLLSSVTRLFIATYSTKMRGGCLRFQAQYLRRLRLPFWGGVPEALRAALVQAASRRDRAACDSATFALYGLTRIERSALGGNED
ncbi:MAG: Eco57I restriction-modification methylase domain-containing protein [Methylococcaceae bacterium]|nr:Eco57I restriction-modification methylase domain-containing protein [Methylococcaceae bacterium]